MEAMTIGGFELIFLNFNRIDKCVYRYLFFANISYIIFGVD